MCGGLDGLGRLTGPGELGLTAKGSPSKEVIQ